jgi:hypothetical protein
VALAAPANDDVRFAEGLNQRRLFQLAETFCRQRLTDERLGPAARVDLTNQYIRILAAHAVQAPLEDRDRVWQQAREAAAEFARRYPDHPRLILVQVQDALTLLARSELHRQEAEVLPDPSLAREAARAALRDAIRSLEQLEQQLTRQIPNSHRQPAAADGLGADELLSLQHHVQHQLARAYRNRALCYDAGSTDRVAALTGALEQLKKPLTQIQEDDPLHGPLRLEAAVCHRLLGQQDQSQRELAALAAVPHDPALRSTVRAEQARVELDRGRLEQAWTLLDPETQSDAVPNADLDLARLETCLAQWKAAADAGSELNSRAWRARSVELVKSIEQEHGPYWGRRASLLLVRIGGGRAAGDVEILARSADELYRAGQRDEAIRVYEQASAGALARGDKDRAFQWGYKAALVDHQRQAYLPASQRLRRLATELADQPSAPAAHLLGAWNAAQAARQHPETLADYAELLQEHVRQWPAAPSADTARLWLGRLRESQQDLAAAIAAYQAVTPSHDQSGEALRAAARCWSARLATQPLAAPEAASLAREAAEFFARQTPPPADASRPWTADERFCAEQAARFWLQPAAAGHASAEAVLQSALHAAPPPDAAWKTRAQSLLVLALAGQPDRRAAAEQLLMSIGNASPAALLEILDGLEAIAQNAGPPIKAALAQLELAVADRLWQNRSQLDAARQRMLQQVRAAALLHAGRREDARRAYAELAHENPDEAPLQQAYAQLLLDGSDPAWWPQALDAWRRIADRSRPQTEAWYQARYAIAQTLLKLGRGDEAAQRIRYLQTLPPGLDGTPWKDKFQTLLEQCPSPR